MSVYERLEPLKLYALHQNSLVDCEITVYEEVFSRIRQALEEILAQALVRTATDEGLLMHEKLVGLHTRSGLNVDTRRTLVLYRRSIAPFDFHLSGMVNSIRAAGLEAEIEEDYIGEKLIVTAKKLMDEFFDLDAVKASLFTMLPAHLEAEFDIGSMTWDMFNSYETTWEKWDSADFTWERFDIDADRLFEEE